LPEPKINLRELEPGDIVTGLSLGEAQFNPLKTFLRRDAKKYHSTDLGKTYAVFQPDDKNRVIAYITLVCGEIVVEENAPAIDDDVDYRYPSFPAVKIARLAVDRRFRDRDLGSLLVQFALGTIKRHICARVGCRFAVVDAKKASVEFYKKQGFTFLATTANEQRDEPVLFIDLAKIAL
jgi:GNAT superfamily N-acetyltransferase